MIASDILKLLNRRVPNYHLLSPRFVKGSCSACPCAACKQALKTQGPKEMVQYVCGRVLEDLENMGAVGYATVSAYGTCDAAQFSQPSYDQFKLEGQKIGGCKNDNCDVADDTRVQA